MFLLTGLEHLPLKINVKCRPDRAESLRKKYMQITPAFHMNKKHWNTIENDGRLPASLIKELGLAEKLGSAIDL